MPAFQRDRKRAPPRNSRKKNFQATECVVARRGAGQSGQKLRDVVEQSAKAGRVAALLSVHAGTAPIEEEHLIARLGKLGAGVFVPASMALDAVYEDDDAARRAGSSVSAVRSAVARPGLFIRRPFAWGAATRQ